jgi:hypothetical protein
MREKRNKYSTRFVKKIYRLARYKNERRKLRRESHIRKIQDQNIKQEYNCEHTQLIVFLVPGSDWGTGKEKISGGTISIVSICEQTAGLKDVHGAQTIMCTMNDDHLLLRHQMFANNTDVYRFEQLATFFTNTTKVLIHLPEFLVEYFPASLSSADVKWLKKMNQVHFNIMNQNIRLMPTPDKITGIKKLAHQVTITTAHQKYCSKQYRDHYGVPIHKLSVWISPEQYKYVKWNEKENLLVVSPDVHPMKEAILEKLQEIEGLTVQIIQNLTYEQYKLLVSRAKWALTFGEGLDGYFIEPVFSGAIAFAVYNEEFFTPDFKYVPAVYPSYTVLQKKIEQEIKLLDQSESFIACQQQQYNLCAKYYNMDQYRDNIKAFYLGNFTYK